MSPRSSLPLTFHQFSIELYPTSLELVAEELEISPSELTFLETFKEGESSLICKVAVHGMDCVMKVVSRNSHFSPICSPF